MDWGKGSNAESSRAIRQSVDRSGRQSRLVLAQRDRTDRWLSVPETEACALSEWR